MLFQNKEINFKKSLFKETEPSEYYHYTSANQPYNNKDHTIQKLNKFPEVIQSNSVIILVYTYLYIKFIYFKLNNIYLFF